MAVAEYAYKLIISAFLTYKRPKVTRFKVGSAHKGLHLLKNTGKIVSLK